jgi:hypothetical protein
MGFQLRTKEVPVVSVETSPKRPVMTGSGEGIILQIPLGSTPVENIVGFPYMLLIYDGNISDPLSRWNFGRVMCTMKESF